MLFFIIGCTTEEKPVFIRKESHTVSKPNKVVSNKIVAMEIEGMTCVMGCGASIRKELYTTEAVSSVEFDFKEGRKIKRKQLFLNIFKSLLNNLIFNICYIILRIPLTSKKAPNPRKMIPIK